ncbi:MAG: hypothetical protein U1D55_17815 [Phycisphaerae bacterium]
MDADTRHELKQNELAETLLKIRLVAERQWKAWVAIVVVAIGALAAYYFWRSSADTARDSAWSAVMSDQPGEKSEADTLARLRALIAEQSDPAILAAARLRAARTLIDQETPDAAQRAANEREALQLFKQTAEDESAPTLIRAAAWFGAGSLNETLRDFEAAKKAFQLLVSDSRYAASPFKALAATRLGSMDLIRSTIAFTPGMPPPPEPPPTQPSATEPTTKWSQSQPAAAENTKPRPENAEADKPAEPAKPAEPENKEQPPAEPPPKPSSP